MNESNNTNNNEKLQCMTLKIQCVDRKKCVLANDCKTVFRLLSDGLDELDAIDVAAKTLERKLTRFSTLPLIDSILQKSRASRCD